MDRAVLEVGGADCVQERQWSIGLQASIMIIKDVKIGVMVDKTNRSKNEGNTRKIEMAIETGGVPADCKWFSWPCLEAGVMG